jgi:protein O-GlcNAc transferase
MATVTEVFSLAVQHHQGGSLGEAELLCRQILAVEPGHADAHDMLGVMAYQLGRFDHAVEFLSRAIELNPHTAIYHLHRGLAYEAVGLTDQAAAAYVKALQLQPDFADAHNNLGNLLHQQGRFSESEAHCRQALHCRSEFPEALNNLGNAILEQDRVDESLQYFQQAMRLNPNFAKAHNNLGNAFKRQDKLDDAARCYQQAVRLDPHFAEAFYNWGIVLEQQGNADNAIRCYRQALQLNPNLAPACNNIGTALTMQGDIEEGIGFLRHALQLNPNYAEAYNNLGIALERQNKLDEALRHYRQALHLKPDFAGACQNLANIHNSTAKSLHQQGKWAEAEASARQAVAQQTDSADAHNTLGNALAEQGKLDEALACYQQAVSVDPDFAGAHGNLAIQLAERGHLDEAEVHFKVALSIEPSERLKLLLATLLPPVYQSNEDLAAWRQRFTANIDKLQNENCTLDLTDQLGVPPFLLAYQGCNDRDLHQKVTKLYAAGKESAPRTPHSALRTTGKIRVGFISRCFKNHTIGQLMRGLIAQLSRDRFDVTVLSIGRHDDAMARWIRQHAEHYVELPLKLPEARRLIAQQQLEVLFYTDIGMEPVTYSLAFSRLAPVQCVTWGHPVTTGIPTIDYFISSEDLESPDSDQQYTERLVRLKHPAIYYYRPIPPSPLEGRAAFGLPESGTLYACPQSLFKFHPEYDEILGGILRQDPQGTLVLVQGKHAHWEALLRQRFAANMAEVQDRIRFLPQLDHKRFLNLNALADVLLDPIHFGGGNTSYEGLALGVPIVTMPSTMLRGRITYALYRQMDVMDCVVNSPEEYVECALRLGTDRDYREATKAKINAASEVLFENGAGAREMEKFLEQAVNQIYQGGERAN